ncbi:MAG: N-carbamoyl-L-amino acid hydrolase [Firmicutes bacterium]|nr:N-carbamoyl-L-amino acid hydrolase [Bacillota bacterium]
MVKSNPERMQKWLRTIASFTEEPGKITRPTYSQAWVDSIEYLREIMDELDMQVRMDTFGNLIGRYDPMASREKPIAIGSHIDSVYNAGAYDGVAGIVVGLELIAMMHENGLCPKYPVEVLATADEEGLICQKGYFGARFMTGDMSIDEMLSYKNAAGKNIETLRKESGIFEGVPFGTDLGWAKDYYSKYLEVHVEQGDVLETAGYDIGIVQGIVGIGRLFFNFAGAADHAGPTVMNGRRDALVAAADLIQKTWELGQANSGEAVTTVGRLSNYPNLHNVISGMASLVVDFRATDDALALALAKQIKEYAVSLREKYGVEVQLVNEIYTPVKFFSEELLYSLRAIELPNSMELFSWAGHDAKAFAQIIDSAMIFMPSIGGKSHSPEEYTKIESFSLACDNLINLLII